MHYQRTLRSGGQVGGLQREEGLSQKLAGPLLAADDYFR